MQYSHENWVKMFFVWIQKLNKDYQQNMQMASWGWKQGKLCYRHTVTAKQISHFLIESL